MISSPGEDGGALLLARFLPATREKFKAAIADLVQRGAQAVILGCTEFGMLLDAGDSSVPLIDTTLAHAEAAVGMALEEDIGTHCRALPR